MKWFFCSINLGDRAIDAEVEAYDAQHAEEIFLRKTGYKPEYVSLMVQPLRKQKNGKFKD